MRTIIVPLGKGGQRMKVRTVKFEAFSDDQMPVCAWCRLQPVHAVVDIIQAGFTVDFCTSICVCPTCEGLATIVEQELPHIVEEGAIER